MIAFIPPSRVAIENLYPEVDQGRFPVKRIEGETLDVWVDIFQDGHDLLRAVILHKRKGGKTWKETLLALDANDRWHGSFPLPEPGRYLYTVKAWPDTFGSWRRDTLKKQQAGQDIALELREGRELAAKLLEKKKKIIKRFDSLDDDALLAEDTEAMVAEHAPHTGAAFYAREVEVLVERRRAEFSAWYELFPRSQGASPENSGTFRDAMERLPEIKAMGFDIIYLPPIHPIGEAFRKGKNNALTAAPGDPGSPYAIGSKDGGHKAVHPELGTLAEFRLFVEAAHALDMEVALDFAVQCSPDHPYLKEHPEWFVKRPDGSIKYAENPPKKYQDIVNVNFESDDADALWQELYSVIDFWIQQGVTLFRVDNPHTKPFAFWEWLIEKVHEKRPDILFLSEAFTRPKVMYRLAKLGFSQSYSYFTWRNTKQELTEYLTELTADWPKEYFRPNFFPTTPDIFPFYLHNSGRPGFMIRLGLAATLSGNYGMLAGYELCEGEPLPGKEEYLDSEKYEIKPRDWNAPGNIKPFVTKLNRIRQENAALQQFKNLRFCPASNDQILFYVKWSSDRKNVVLVAVNLDYRNAQEAYIEMPLHFFSHAENKPYRLDDLLLGHSWQWSGARQHIRLDPKINPLAIFRFSL